MKETGGKSENQSLYFHSVERRVLLPILLLPFPLLLQMKLGNHLSFSPSLRSQPRLLLSRNFITIIVIRSSLSPGD